jgi:membrane-associated phospholipid phosphatase
VGSTDDVRGRGAAALVPTYRHPLVGPVALLGILLVAVPAVRYAGTGEAGRLDRALAALVPMPDGVVGSLGEALADLGDPFPVVVVMAVLAAAAWWWRGGRGLALALVAPAAAMVTTSLVLKPIVGRTRGHKLSFPSGHTTAVAGIAATAAVLVLGTPTLTVRVRRVVSGTLGVLVVAVGVCLVGRGYHYPTDVLGALGVVLALVPPTALVVDAFAGLGDEGDRVRPGAADPGAADAGAADPGAADPRDVADAPTGRLPAAG